jgi:hypothetical protein
VPLASEWEGKSEMNGAYFSEGRIAGGVLVAPILVGMAAAAIGLLRQAGRGYSAGVQGDLEGMAPHAETLDVLILLFVLSWIVHLIGMGLLGRLLARAGAEQLAVVAFVLILVSVLSALMKYSFDMTVELWAAKETARVGSLPALFEPLSKWTSSLFQLGYALHYVAVAGIGWAIVRSGLLSPSLGWAAIGWSGLWLAGALVGVGIPAVPMLMPAILGVALMST